MYVRFTCPGCGKKLKVADEHGGKEAKCPGCGKVLIISVPAPQPRATDQPSTPTQAAPPPPPAPEPARKTPSETPVEYRTAGRRSSFLTGNTLVLAKWGALSGVLIICVVILVRLWSRTAEQEGITLFGGGNNRTVAADAGGEKDRPQASRDESRSVAQLPANPAPQQNAQPSVPKDRNHQAQLKAVDYEIVTVLGGGAMTLNIADGYGIRIRLEFSAGYLNLQNMEVEDWEISDVHKRETYFETFFPPDHTREYGILFFVLKCDSFEPGDISFKLKKDSRWIRLSDVPCRN